MDLQQRIEGDIARYQQQQQYHYAQLKELEIKIQTLDDLLAPDYGESDSDAPIARTHYGSEEVEMIFPNVIEDIKDNNIKDLAKYMYAKNYIDDNKVTIEHLSEEMNMAPLYITQISRSHKLFRNMGTYVTLRPITDEIANNVKDLNKIDDSELPQVIHDMKEGKAKEVAEFLYTEYDRGSDWIEAGILADEMGVDRTTVHWVTSKGLYQNYFEKKTDKNAKYNPKLIRLSKLGGRS